MAYKSIFVHWEDSPAGAVRFDLAARLASRYEGHVTVLCTGIAPEPPMMMYGGYAVDLVTQNLDEVRKGTAAQAEAARQRIDAAGVLGEAREVITTASSIARVIGNMTRFADLILVGQPYGATQEDLLIQVLEGALFDGGVATLVVPNHETRSIGETVTLAWNGSREALHAVRGAMGFMQEAKRTEILLIDPDTGLETDEGPEPGSDIALLLARHGIDVTISRLASAGRPVGEILTNHVVDTGSDLLVMGAYGHSRFREFVLGGATRTVLRAVPVPVLMAH